MAEVVCRGLVDWTATTEPDGDAERFTRAMDGRLSRRVREWSRLPLRDHRHRFQQLADLLLRFISSRPRLTGLADGAVWHDGHVDLRAGAHVCRELFIPKLQSSEFLNDQVVHMRRTQLGAAASNRD